MAKTHVEQNQNKTLYRHNQYRYVKVLTLRLKASRALAALRNLNEMMIEIRKMKRRVENPRGCFAHFKAGLCL